MSEAQIDADRDHKTDDDPERHAMLNGGHGHIAYAKCDRERKDLSNSLPLHGISLLSHRLHYQDEAEHDHDHSEQYALGTEADRRNQ
jgi:hypothetical protein